MKKNNLTLLTILLTAGILSAQKIENFTFGIQASIGPTKAHIRDDDAKTSSQNLASDGYTSIEVNNLSGQNFKLMANYELNETFDLGSGLSFLNKGLNVKNVDGSYVGTSVYRVSYVQIPILLRYKSKEITDKLKFIGSIGPTFDLKSKEYTVKADYAHFMNFANNRFDLDNQRGQNGNNKNLSLFNQIGVSATLTGGVEYQIKERFNLYGGLSYQRGLTNMLNKKLQFNDVNKTRITTNIFWRTSLIAFDFGVGFKFN